MGTTQQREQCGAEERQGREKLTTLIGERVIRALGKPQGLYRVQVWPLWAAYYRVNVLVGEAASVEIPNSYFVEADDDGNILSAVPRITKQY
jgi:hypothetical protein